MKPFFDALRQPEYVHVLLNPLPVYGLALSALALALALAARNRPAQLIALVLVLLCAGSAWPVYQYGEGATTGSKRWRMPLGVPGWRGLYEKKGIPRERVLIKIASTWEGIKAAEQLQKESINCNLTLLFSFPQGRRMRRGRRPADLALCGPDVRLVQANHRQGIPWR